MEPEVKDTVNQKETLVRTYPDPAPPVESPGHTLPGGRCECVSDS